MTTKSPGSSPVVINGMLSDSAGTISTFTVNGLGEGTLTVNTSPTPTTYNIVQVARRTIT
ncbi:MAG: hypothetical protein JO092_00310 [Candidatus Eremiobacteraeota bacterium]|nr:hypothetical protein [Candidatus Eremiobacteraeota bacterium]